jgi:secondary thiamine-phosphate synthase enzyme
MTFRIVTDSFHLSTRGHSQVIDVTAEVDAIVARHDLSEGQVLVFVPGATAGLTTLEFEPGLVRDLPEMFERIAPRAARYEHEQMWHDGNGHSHVRAALLGPSLTVPVRGGKMLLGTWQQIVLLDFDNRSREREIVVQLTGESREDGQRNGPTVGPEHGPG